MGYLNADYNLQVTSGHSIFLNFECAQWRKTPLVGASFLLQSEPAHLMMREFSFRSTLEQDSELLLLRPLLHGRRAIVGGLKHLW
jgi:hypothetical protein